MNKKMLDGWKEISDYVGKSPKTLRRWEKEEGFPIIRLKDKKSVFADPEEIDRWLENRKNHKNHAKSDGTPEKNKQRIKKKMSKKSDKYLIAIITCLVVFAFFSLTKYYLKQKQIEKLKQRKLCYTIEGDGYILNIKDQYGNILKTFKSEAKIFRHYAFDQKNRITIKFTDINGDGIEDMIYGELDPAEKKYLRIFISDNRGNLLEKKKFNLAFSYYRKKTRENFEVFEVNSVESADLDSDGKQEIIVIQNNSPLYPSCLRIFDLNGREKFRFIHPGRLYVLQVVNLDGNKKAIITGGANNYIHQFSLPVVIILKSDWKNLNHKVIDWIQPENTNFAFLKEFEITYFTFFVDNYKIIEYEEAYLSPRYNKNNKFVVSGIHFPEGDRKTIKIFNMTFTLKTLICELIFNSEGKIKTKLLSPEFIGIRNIKSEKDYIKKHCKVYYYNGEKWQTTYTKITKQFHAFKQVFPVKNQITTNSPGKH